MRDLKGRSRGTRTRSEDEELRSMRLCLTLFRQGFLWVAFFWGGGKGGGRKVPAAYNSKTINDNEMKFGRVVKDH